MIDDIDHNRLMDRIREEAADRPLTTRVRFKIACLLAVAAVKILPRDFAEDAVDALRDEFEEMAQEFLLGGFFDGEGGGDWDNAN